MAQQTAVEWLIDEIEKHYIINNGSLDSTVVMELKRQAKAMEKEQIEDSFQEGKWDWQNHITTKIWYNTTTKPMDSNWLNKGEGGDWYESHVTNGDLLTILAVTLLGSGIIVTLISLI